LAQAAIDEAVQRAQQAEQAAMARIVQIERGPLLLFANQRFFFFTKKKSKL
jgi:hypothetical protein